MSTTATTKRVVWNGRYFDPWLLLPTISLLLLGIVMVYSASSTNASKSFATSYYYLQRQLLFAAVALIGMFLGRHFSYTNYRWLVYPLLAVSAILLILVKIPGVGLTVKGASRWLQLGSFSFQPSDLTRLALIIFLAYSLAKKEATIKRFSIGFVPHVGVLLFFVLMISLQPDFGSMLILIVLTWVMMFAGGVRLVHLLSPLPFVIPALIFFMKSAPYRVARLTSFWDPWAYATDTGYQVVHSQMAFGTGGLIGTGLGRSYQKLFFLPEPHTDFIFSVLGEELGFLGVTGVILLYLMIIWRGFRIAWHCPDRFGSLLAVGVTASLGFQVSINMCVTLGLLPPKGLPLPLMSYGGTSLLMTLMALGILMNISGTVPWKVRNRHD